jgi:hypothetical protein
MMLMTRVFLLGLVALVFGCDSPTGPEEERVAGIIAGVNPDGPHIVVPDTVQAGEAFTVVVRTYGADGCVRKGETKVEMEGRTAVVAPYNLRHVGEEVVCLDVLQTIEHTATLQFDEVGPALVLLHPRPHPPIRCHLPAHGLCGGSADRHGHHNGARRLRGA